VEIVVDPRKLPSTCLVTTSRKGWDTKWS